jgi:DnaK suppressor protein
MSSKKDTSSVQSLDMDKAAQITPEYTPSDSESYMNPKQLEYFRQKLQNWRQELLKDSLETIHNLQEETHNEPDIADRASAETDRALELRTRDRERKLISKIDEAIRRIDDGSYGFCEETGDPIGLARLEARPIATLSLEAQERHEKQEKIYREE